MPGSIATSPSSGCSWPVIMRNSVVLPAPFGPDKPDLLALLDAHRGFDEQDLVAVLLGDVVEADHEIRDGGKKWPNTVIPSEAARRAAQSRDLVCSWHSMRRSLRCASLRSAPVGMTEVDMRQHSRHFHPIALRHGNAPVLAAFSPRQRLGPTGRPRTCRADRARYIRPDPRRDSLPWARCGPSGRRRWAGESRSPCRSRTPRRRWRSRISSQALRRTAGSVEVSHSLR